VYLLSGLLRCETCAESDNPGDYAHWIGNRKKLPDSENRFTYSYQCGRKNTAKSPTTCSVIPLPAKEIENFVLEECIKLVENPKGVYEYQQKLSSTKLEVKRLQKRQQYLLGVLNSLPQQREAVRHQHKEGIIDIKKLQDEIRDMESREKVMNDEIDSIERDLSRKTISESYIRSLEAFAEKYKGSLKELREDRQQAHEFLHLLIASIDVRSRPVVPEDKIAGKKKGEQRIPSSLRVKLRLPQEFLKEIVDSHMVKPEGSGQKVSNGGDGGNRTLV
jgi:hypothetical protein